MIKLQRSNISCTINIRVVVLFVVIEIGTLYFNPFKFEERVLNGGVPVSLPFFQKKIINICIQHFCKKEKKKIGCLIV